MRVGASLRTSFIVDDVRQAAGWLVERARAAWEAELDSLFVGDKHVIGAPYYQNSPLLGRLLAESVDSSPLAPARVRSDSASCEQQFAGMGVDHSRRPSRFEAGLDIIRRLLAGSTVTADGPDRLHEAVVSPARPEPVEVWVGGTAERAVDRGARLGDGFLSDAP